MDVTVADGLGVGVNEVGDRVGVTETGESMRKALQAINVAEIMSRLNNRSVIVMACNLFIRA